MDVLGLNQECLCRAGLKAWPVGGGALAGGFRDLADAIRVQYVDHSLSRVSRKVAGILRPVG
jgi:hypothetical protein